jgi:hypothetical protein
MWLTLALVMALSSVVMAQDAGTACGGLLKNGVYNTISSSITGVTYAQAQDALCTDTSTYTYAAYSTDFDSRSQSTEFASVGLQAQTVKLRLGGSGGGGSSKLTQSEFSTVQKYAAAYRVTSCGTSSSNTGTSTTIDTLQQFIDPGIVSAYRACVDLYRTGMTTKQTWGDGFSSTAVDFKFASTVAGAFSDINSIIIDPPNAAICKVDGRPLNSTGVRMVVGQTYSVVCATSSSYRFRERVNIFIGTSYGSYQTALYNSPPLAQLGELSTTLAMQRGLMDAQGREIAALKTSVAGLQSKADTQAAEIATLKSQVAALLADVSTLKGIVSAGKLTLARGWTLETADGNLKFVHNGAARIRYYPGCRTPGSFYVDGFVNIQSQQFPDSYWQFNKGNLGSVSFIRYAGNDCGFAAIQGSENVFGQLLF